MTIHVFLFRKYLYVPPAPCATDGAKKSMHVDGILLGSPMVGDAAASTLAAIGKAALVLRSTQS
jgi:hypothetical protein